MNTGPESLLVERASFHYLFQLTRTSSNYSSNCFRCRYPSDSIRLDEHQVRSKVWRHEENLTNPCTASKRAKAPPPAGETSLFTQLLAESSFRVSTSPQRRNELGSPQGIHHQTRSSFFSHRSGPVSKTTWLGSSASSRLSSGET